MNSHDEQRKAIITQIIVAKFSNMHEIWICALIYFFGITFYRMRALWSIFLVLHADWGFWFG